MLQEACTEFTMGLETRWASWATHDLHYHYDGSITPAVVRRALQHSPDVEVRAKQLEQHAILRAPVCQPEDFFAVFDTIYSLFDSRESMVSLLEALLWEESVQGLKYLDFRFGNGALSRQLSCSEEETFGRFVQAFREAEKRGLQISPTLCFSRNEPMSRAAYLQEFVLSHREVIRAVDLAGPEVPHCTSEFAPFFQTLRSAGLHVTIHAGEFAGSEAIWQAIDDCGAERIGHGCAAAQDPALLRRLAQDRIAVEVCLSSNFFTGVCTDLRQHPLVLFVEYGVPVVLCSDDRAIFATTLAQEYQKAAEILTFHGIDPLPVLSQCAQNARRYAF